MAGYDGVGSGRQESTWSESEVSSANAQVTATHAGAAGRRHYVVGFEAAVSGGDLGSDVTVTLLEDSTVKWRTYLGSGAARGERVGLMFPKPLMFASGAAAAIRATAGGAAVVIAVNIVGYTAAE